MSQSNAVQCTKSIAQSRAEIYSLFDVKQHGGLIWNALDLKERRSFCFAAGLKQSHIDKPLADFDDLERQKLLSTIKTLAASAAKFNSLSLQDFK